MSIFVIALARTPEADCGVPHRQGRRNSMTHPQGVYFLANDYVLDLAVTFLNSFRKYNPTIPLCLVPFDADICKVTALADKYGFEIYDNMEVLYECDRISESFHDTVL